MANTIDYITCSHASFIKYLEESSPKEQTFKNIFEQINVKYIALATEIYKINEKRHELLEKIKAAQSEFKRLFGHGEIKPVIDANDDEDVDNTIIQEPKTSDKRGRKKVVPIEENKVDTIEEELENIPKMKGKETKKSTVKQVKPDDEEEDEEEPVKEEKVTKTLKKVSPPPVPSKKATSSKKEVLQELDDEVQEELIETVEPVKLVTKKTTKTVKTDTAKTDAVETVQTKATTKKKTTK
jgi:hypothetical protein